MSWISVDDLAAAYLYAVEDPGLEGPCNGVAPGAARNRDFTKILARVLNRPAVVPVPGPVLKLAYGQMAKETILASCRVAPNRLVDAGFGFRHPDLESALRHMLGRAERNRDE
jgi:NAD dependent epimerase/dehydratase family enzyme